MKKKVLIIISVTVAILLLVGSLFIYYIYRPPTKEQVQKYEQLLAQGDLLFDAREYSEAVDTYNDAAKVIHTDPRAYSKIVNIYLLKNDFDTALSVAQRAQNYTTSAESSLIYSDIAKSYFENENYYEARINYEIAASLQSNPTVNLGLSKAYVYNREFDLAKELLKKEYDPDSIDEAKLLYAYILGTEDKEKTEKFLKEYTVVDSNMNSYFEEYLSVIKSLDEDKLFNATKLSRIYINNRYPTLAIRMLEGKSEDIIQYVDALYYLGTGYLNSKEYDKSIETLLKAASLLGYESEKYWMLARAYYKKDDLVNAITYYDMAVGYAGDNLSRELVEEYLDILLSSNQKRKSEEVYTDIVKEIESEWLYLIGLELYYGESESKFDYYLGKLANMEMDDKEKEEYLFWKVRRSIEKSEVENIEQDFETLLELNRFNPQYYWAKGLYEMYLSDTKSAKDSFELALEYDLEGKVTKEVEELLARFE